MYSLVPNTVTLSLKLKFLADLVTFTQEVLDGKLYSAGITGSSITVKSFKNL